LQPARKEDYIKIVTMLEDVPDDCTPWMADVLVESSDTDYNNKFGWFQDNHETKVRSR